MKELYGEDYDDPLGLDDDADENSAARGGDRSSVTGVKDFKNRMAEKISLWVASAKDKYAEELNKPDSKVNAVRTKLAQLNEEMTGVNLEKQIESAMVALGAEEPMAEAEGMSGMFKNPYRKNLDQFLQEDCQEET